jgi:hypothetical protein
MEKKIIKKLTTGTLIVVLLSLSLAISPALACNTQSQKIKNIVVRGNLLNEELQLPLVLEVKAIGLDKTLFGAGTIQDPACGKSIIAVAGSIEGHTLILSGCIVRGIDTPELKGSPVKLVADSNSGEIAFTLGPIAGGLPLSGLTFVFTGEGTISIR